MRKGRLIRDSQFMWEPPHGYCKPCNKNLYGPSLCMHVQLGRWSSGPVVANGDSNLQLDVMTPPAPCIPAHDCWHSPSNRHMNVFKKEASPICLQGSLLHCLTACAHTALFSARLAFPFGLSVHLKWSSWWSDAYWEVILVTSEWSSIRVTHITYHLAPTN